MTSVNKRLLQVKIKEKNALQEKFDELERAVQALTLAAEIEESESIEENTPKKYQPKNSWKKMGKDRTKKVTELLSAATGETHFNYIAKQLSILPITTKDWLLSQIKRKGDRCPWKIGKNKSYFILR